VQAPREEYRAAIGPFIDRRRDHKMLGDPEKAAHAILKVAGADDAPLRLLLGSDAVMVAGQALATRAAEDAKWRALSESTNADDADAREWLEALSKIGGAPQPGPR